MDSFIYVIGADVGPVKIGHSREPQARLSEIQIGSMEKLSVLFQLPHTHVKEVEAQVHRALVQYRLSGEWFDVPREIAIAAIHFAAARVEDAPPKPASDFEDWQVKGFSVAMRKTIVALAKAQHLTVAEWMHAYIEQHPFEPDPPTREERIDFLIDTLAELIADMQLRPNAAAAPPTSPEAPG